MKMAKDSLGWINKYLLWQSIMQHYNEDLDRPLKLLPKLIDQCVLP